VIAQPAAPATTPVVGPVVAPRGAARRGAITAAAIVGLTASALVWVTLASDLAARGLRVNALLGERQALVMRRAAARTALGMAADPRRLAQRAAALGFGPPDEVAFVVATVPYEGAPAVAADAAPDADSPLALWLAGRPADEAAPAPWRIRLALPGGWRPRDGAAP